MSEERCGSCRFWKQDEYDQHRGNCRRYPPTQDIGRAVAVALNLRDVLKSKEDEEGNQYSHDEEIYTPYVFEELDDGCPAYTYNQIFWGWQPEMCFHEWCGEWQAKPANDAP